MQRYLGHVCVQVLLTRLVCFFCSVLTDDLGENCPFSRTKVAQQLEWAMPFSARSLDSMIERFECDRKRIYKRAVEIKHDPLDLIWAHVFYHVIFRGISLDVRRFIVALFWAI